MSLSDSGSSASQSSTDSSEYSYETESYEEKKKLPLTKNVFCFVCKRLMPLVSAPTTLDIEKGNTTSFPVAICDCDPATLKYHDTCLSSHISKGNTSCSVCDQQFRVALQTKIIFSSSRFYTAAKFIGQCFATLLLLMFVIFCAAPTDWIDLFTGNSSTYREVLQDLKSGSIFLFPTTDLVMVDIFYVIVVLISIVMSIVFTVIGFRFSEEPTRYFQRLWRREKYLNLAFVFTVFLSTLLLFLHLFGMIHFAFYYGVGVIKDKRVVQFYFNWATLCAGPAGMALVYGIIFIPPAAIWAAYRSIKFLIFNYCCFSISQQVIINGEKK